MDQPTWIGRSLSGRYRIDALLGQGGMSAVYKATDPNLKRVVAVKLIHSHLSADPAFIQRFESEASAVASLRHPNIVQVFDFNNDNGTYYMVLEFIPGETLYDRLQRLAASSRKLTLIEALKFTLNISEAMSYAHQRGMVHRDIKPANIMLDTHGQAILMDFGIVKIMGGESHTSTGALVGTARYMSPETIRGEIADYRSDIYSLGVTLFEMIGGRPPFVADSAMTLMMMHLNDPIPDVREFRPDIPQEIVAILQRCLAKNREDRFQSASELSTQLKHALAALEGQPTALITNKPQPQSQGQSTVVAQSKAKNQPEKATATAGQAGSQESPAEPRQPKKKTNLLWYLLGGGAVALVLFVIAGVLVYRNIAARGASALIETPTLEILPSTAPAATDLPPGENVALFETGTLAALAPTNTPTLVTYPTGTTAGEPQHLQSPEASFNEGKNIFDVVSKDTGPEGRAPYGDIYDANLLERPFLQDMTYLPDVDIMAFNIRQTDVWYYVSLDIIGTDPNNPLGIRYGVELDKNKDGFGDFIIFAAPPYTAEWSTLGIQVYADQNHDTAGNSPNKSDAPFTADGYETLVFDGSQGVGEDPDLAWARYYDEHTVQVAFKRSWVGESFMYGILADASLKDTSTMDYNDRFSVQEAGSPVRDNSYYPLRSLFAYDNTCRGAVGFSALGYEPRICASIVTPSATPTRSVTPTPDPLVCQPPPGGCPADAPNWWPSPHCACSITPYNP